MANTKTQPPGVTPAERRYRKMLEGRDRAEYEALAATKGVTTKTLVWWRWEIERRDRTRGILGARAKSGALSSKEESLPFLPVRVAPPLEAVHEGADGGGAPRSPRGARRAPLLARGNYRIEVRLRSGHEVTVPRSFDAEDLRRLVAVLEGTPC